MTTRTAPEVTVGIDIGTSSVKAVAADEDGNIIARARIPHEFDVPTPLRFQHDAADAWHRGPRRALAALGEIRPRGVAVGAMVPSLTAVDDDGVPCTPGLLYGDERGHTGSIANPAESGELMQFLRWTARERPDARGYWMAQAVANYALCGAPLVSTTVAATAFPLFDWTGWDSTWVGECGARGEQMPEIAVSGQPVAEVRGYDGCVLEAGTIDALGDQIVAGADHEGDVLVLLGTTLIVWAVVPELVDAGPLFCIPHTAPGGKWLVGGPSNAGGLFLNWVNGLTGEGPVATGTDDVPVWVPYPRGERVPVHDATRRGQLLDLNLTHHAPAVRRAAYEASGFVTKRMIDASPVPARRIVVTGGGTRVDAWVQAVADATALPVHVCATPETGALGAAFLARMAAGLETNMTDASRWARTERIVEPDVAAADAVAYRYTRFVGTAV
ncbi:MAG: xylulokinase [Actinomycetota bacterium]